MDLFAYAGHTNKCLVLYISQHQIKLHQSWNTETDGKWNKFATNLGRASLSITSSLNYHSCISLHFKCKNL